MSSDQELTETGADRWSRNLHRRFGGNTIWLYVGLGIVNATIGVVVEVPAGAQYIDASFRDVMPIALGALGLGAVCVLAAAIAARSFLLPALRWMRSDRLVADAPQAWESATRGMTRVLLIGFTLFALAYLPLAAYGMDHLGLRGYDFFVVYGFLFTGIAFSTTLDYFAFQWLLRPVLRDVAERLPVDYEVRLRPPSLRARLLLVMTVVSALVAIVTAGVVNTGSGTTRFATGMIVVAIVVLLVGLPPVALLADDVSRPFRELMRGARRAEAGDLTSRVPILAADEGGAMASQFNAMLRGMRERQVLRNAIDTYVNPAVADRLVAEGNLLDGQEVVGTIMFVDIRNFTDWCERRSVADAVALLNEFFGAVVPCIEDSGGHVNKFMGDGLLAGFGAPVPSEDHAVQAVRAARAVTLASARQFKGDLQVGIGINSGPFIIGTVGGGGHLEFALIGDVVNVAARVEQLTKETGDQILATEATVAFLPPGERFASRGSMPVRGRSEAVTVYALQASSDGEAALADG